MDRQLHIIDLLKERTFFTSKDLLVFIIAVVFLIVVFEILKK